MSLLCNIRRRILLGLSALDLMIVIVGHGLALGQNFRFHHLPDEQGVAAQFHRLDHLQVEMSQAVVQNFRIAAGAELVVDPAELVHLPPALESEGAYHGQRRFLGEHRDREFFRTLDELVGQVLAVEADRHQRRLGRHLKDGVGYLAVQLSLPETGDYVHPVTDKIEGFGIDVHLF